MVMTGSAVVIIVIAMFLLIGGAIVWFLLMEGADADPSGQFGAILSAQRGLPSDLRERKAFFITPETEAGRVDRSSLTLERKLKYAQMKMSPKVWWLWSIGIGIVAFLIASRIFAIFLAVFFLFLGHLIMSTYTTIRLERRFKAFDKDYAQFLLSLVGLLKTGMNSLNGLEAAAEGLEPGALVRQEVELMLERLRFGVPEEKSIGTLGEDINHPEIELFVQALLLNKRLGGNLSDTLERLAKQVRRRQYFRQAAVAAIGLQRGSLWFIILILVIIEFYLYFVMPNTVIESLKDEVGWQGWQGALLLIMIGILWLRQVTRIRV